MAQNHLKIILTKRVYKPLYIYFHHTTCESTCDTLTSSAANEGDNTVSVAQGSGSFKNNINKTCLQTIIYIYIYIYI